MFGQFSLRNLRPITSLRIPPFSTSTKMPTFPFFHLRRARKCVDLALRNVASVASARAPPGAVDKAVRALGDAHANAKVVMTPAAAYPARCTAREALVKDLRHAASQLEAVLLARRAVAITNLRTTVNGAVPGFLYGVSDSDLVDGYLDPLRLLSRPGLVANRAAIDGRHAALRLAGAHLSVARGIRVDAALWATQLQGLDEMEAQKDDDRDGEGLTGWRCVWLVLLTMMVLAAVAAGGVVLYKRQTHGGATAATVKAKANPTVSPTVAPVAVPVAAPESIASGVVAGRVPTKVGVTMGRSARSGRAAARAARLRRIRKRAVAAPAGTVLRRPRPGVMAGRKVRSGGAARPPTRRQRKKKMAVAAPLELTRHVDGVAWSGGPLELPLH